MNITRRTLSFRPMALSRCVGAILLALLWGGAARAQYVDWIRQLGTAGVDGFWGVSTDATGNIYAVGDTGGSLFATQKGSGDAIVARYNSSGALLGGFQDGTNTSDRFTAAAGDGAGGVFVAGYTSSGTFGPPVVGTGDGVFGYISPSNTWTWLRQSATDNSIGGGGSNTGTLVTAGAVFSAVAGPYSGGGDALLQVRNAAGVVAMQQQFGTAGYDGGNAIAVDPFGNYLVAGTTTGALAGPNAGGADAFVAKFDAAGNQLWARQLGSAATDAGTSVTTDASGNVYFAGITDGAIGAANAGASDDFIAKYDSFGNLVWIKQFGTAAPEGNPLVANFMGAVWLATSTSGNLFGPNAGSLDVAAVRLDVANGNTLWSTQIGTALAEHALAIDMDQAFGRLYIAGLTNGSFAGPNAGGDDAMLIAINALPHVPEPATIGLMALAGAMIVIARRRCVNAAK